MIVYRIINGRGQAWKGGIYGGSMSHYWSDKAGQIYTREADADRVLGKITADTPSNGESVVSAGARVVAYELVEVTA